MHVRPYQHTQRCGVRPTKIEEEGYRTKKHKLSYYYRVVSEEAFYWFPVATVRRSPVPARFEVLLRVSKQWSHDFQPVDNIGREFQGAPRFDLGVSLRFCLCYVQRDDSGIEGILSLYYD